MKQLFAFILLAGVFDFGISAHQAAARTPGSPEGGTTSNSAAESGVETPPAPCRILYAGFVGAMEPAGNKHSGVVQIRDTLRGPDYADVCAESFLPISWNSGRDWILKHFPSHPGPLTQEELANAPRVILVGHSTGGWAMLSVARDLRDKDIPVELTIQVDSVGITDHTIPRNVKAGAIFHAWDILMFMTTKRLKLEDPLHTKLVANVVVHGANHLSVTRDLRIRSLVMKTVDELRAESENASEKQPPPTDSLPQPEKVPAAPGSGPSD